DLDRAVDDDGCTVEQLAAGRGRERWLPERDVVAAGGELVEPEPALLVGDRVVRRGGGDDPGGAERAVVGLDAGDAGDRRDDDAARRLEIERSRLCAGEHDAEPGGARVAVD